MTVVPASFISESSLMTASVLSLSRSDVGSSARRTSGLLARALAMDALRCPPPESSLGNLSAKSPIPSLSRMSCASCGLFPRP